MLKNLIKGTVLAAAMGLVVPVAFAADDMSAPAGNVTATASGMAADQAQSAGAPDQAVEKKAHKKGHKKGHKKHHKGHHHKKAHHEAAAK